METPSSNSPQHPSILESNYIECFNNNSIDKQYFFENFYNSLKKLPAADYCNDTVISNIQQMFNVTVNHRKHYRDQYNRTLKKFEESAVELKSEKKFIEVLKKQNEEERKKIQKISAEIELKENELFEAEKSVSKLKKELKDVREESEGAKEALISVFKKDMEELEEKRDENGCLRKEILKVVKEKNDQIEINKSLKNKLEQLQNEILTAAKKQMEKSDSQRMALKEFNKSVKNVKVKKADVTKNEKMEDEILRLKEKQDIQKNAIDEWTNKAMSQNASLLEKEHLIEKLNCELQSQMEETAAIKKELNLFKNEVEVQQEKRTCENEILQNRKRPSIDAKEKNPKQTKITVNQENHQPSHNSPPSFHGISAKQQQSLFQKENLPCQKSIPFQETQSRQPFTKIQNIPPGHDYSQQQPQINYSNFSAQNISAMQFPHYYSHFYQYFNTNPGFPNFKF